MLIVLLTTVVSMVFGGFLGSWLGERRRDEQMDRITRRNLELQRRADNAEKKKR